MYIASAVLLTSIFALSAPHPHLIFRYDLLHSIHRTTDSCRVCYGDECTSMSEARCEYYAEADQLMEKDDESEKGDMSMVDGMMSDLTQEAVMSWTADKCIPYISYYTSCNKENICVGCKTCYCEEPGTWSCQLVQRCRPEASVKVDHRILAAVIQRLSDVSADNKKRKKRLAKQGDTKSGINQISFLDIAEWMPKIKSNSNMELLKPTTHNDVTIIRTETENKVTTTQQSINSVTPMENEYLGFDEVLKNIAIEDHKRRRSWIKDNKHADNDYLDSGKHKVDDENCTKQFLSVLNAIEEGRDVTEPTGHSMLVVDLFPRGNINNYVDNSGKENADANNIALDTSYNGIELEPVNRMKRNTMSVSNLSNASQDKSLTTTLETTTDKENDVENNVLRPLTNIIDDKQNEIKELLQIKENLLRIMNIYYNNTELNMTRDLERVNGTTYFSIYKLDLFPEIQENLRRNNLNILDKFLYKLKRDIYEVLRDVAGIQKISSTRGLPDDLKMLIRSMKSYISKQGSIRNFKRKDIQLETMNKNTRRSQVTPAESTPKTIKQQLIAILDALDKESIQSDNALVKISKFPKKIMKRVIKQTNIDESAIVGLKISDNEYNLTTDLRTIGRAWPQMIENIAKSPQHEKIYALKLLHLTLASDIVKISDAIALIDFAHNRRIARPRPTQVSVAEGILANINSGLNSMKNKVETMIQHHTPHEKNVLQENESILKKHNEKQSFLKRLKNFLKRSKNDIIHLTKKNISKSIQTTAKTECNERSKLAEDTQTMLKWQASSDISRRKRDLAHPSNMKDRMKNIIPRYLRGKINPAIEKKKRQSATKRREKR